MVKRYMEAFWIGWYLWASHQLNEPFYSQYVPETRVINNDGLVDSIGHLLFTDKFTKPYSHENLLVHLLTTVLKYITRLFILTDIHNIH